MRLKILQSLGLVLLAVLGAGVAGTSVATANPAGLFVSNESCSGGRVLATLNWTPDSAGQQYVDLSARNDNFAASYSTSGPLPAGRSQEALEQLQPNTTYYMRVSTLIGTEFLRSATLSYTTRSCGSSAGSTGGGSSSGNATAPIHLQAAAFSATQARFQWVPGTGNRYFCIDYAKSLNDLLNRFGSWRNSGCGTTGTSHVVSGLACGTNYFARVWTPAGGGLYSSIGTVQTYSCANAISPPAGLKTIFITNTKARLDWNAGKDNRWFCIDTARSRADLLSFGNSWRNHACGTTFTQATISGLRCDTLYFWRVYTWNPIANAHSEISTFTTDDCDTKQVKAPIEDVDVDRVNGEYLARIEVGRPDACHTFGSYSADTFGNVIELTVYNKQEPGACAQVYSTYNLTINLGSNYASGVRYIVTVNDEESDTFIAN
jgi:hypothetical protein